MPALFPTGRGLSVPLCPGPSQSFPPASTLPPRDPPAPVLSALHARPPLPCKPSTRPVPALTSRALRRPQREARRRGQTAWIARLWRTRREKRPRRLAPNLRRAWAEPAGPASPRVPPTHVRPRLSGVPPAHRAPPAASALRNSSEEVNFICLKLVFC